MLIVIRFVNAELYKYRNLTHDNCERGLLGNAPPNQKKTIKYTELYFAERYQVTPLISIVKHSIKIPTSVAFI